VEPTPSPKRPTLTSIARSLDLSIATVSNVYNHPDRVSDRIRELVLNAADAAGYAGPDASARQFRRGRADTLGVIFTDELSFALKDPAAAAFLSGLASSCEDAGLNLLLIPAGPPPHAAKVSAVTNAIVDGFVVYSVPEGDPHLGTAMKRNLPLVVVDEPDSVEGADWVGPDDRAAMRELAEHLIGLGHRRVGIVSSRLDVVAQTGPADRTRWGTARYSVMRKRIQGIADALSAAGLPPSALQVEERFSYSAEAGAEGLHALLDRSPDITAVCCIGDVLAIGALRAAEERGLRVPDDVSITGFDDIPEASRAGLTTVTQPLVEKGAIAGEFFLTHAAEGPGRRHMLPTHVTVRRTTAPARH
jgi:DNA-binding LacI/PurR family transcriptional regulator